MEELKDIVQSSSARSHELVAEVCAREGAANVVRVVDELVATGQDGHFEALLFLHFGQELPEMIEALGASKIDETLAELLRNGAFWDRRGSVWALGTLPLPSGQRRLAEAAPRLEAAGDIITLSSTFRERVAVAEVIASLRASSDWLKRWTLVSFLNMRPEPGLAGEVARELAGDPCPWIAEEAGHLLVSLEEEWAERARFPELPPDFVIPSGAKIRVVAGRTRGLGHSGMDDDPPRAFGDLTELFVEEWPQGKCDYTLEELRAFIEARRGVGSPAARG